MLYPFPKITRDEARPYQLNQIDAIMDCSTYLTARPVERENLPAYFDRRLAVAMPTLPDERATDIFLARFLQYIAQRGIHKAAWPPMIMNPERSTLQGLSPLSIRNLKRAKKDNVKI